MVFQTKNKKLLELGPSLGFLFLKNVYFPFIERFITCHDNS